jgi:hypothetical protein
MQLPNKLYSYSESILPVMLEISRELKHGNIKVSELYMKIKPGLKDSTDFILAMDCLFALKIADINQNEEAYLC